MSDTITLLVSSGGGPEECRRAVAHILRRMVKEAKLMGTLEIHCEFCDVYFINTLCCPFTSRTTVKDSAYNPKVISFGPFCTRYFTIFFFSLLSNNFTFSVMH